MKLTILGCYAATPRRLTNPTSQVLEIRNHFFLIDCSEGTQVQLRKNKIRFSKINHIFISHLHGDHFFGLPGLISSFQLLGRVAPLNIYGPKGIKFLIQTILNITGSKEVFPLLFHELENANSEQIFEDDSISISTIPLQHRIYTNGFLFREKTLDRKLNTYAVEEYDLPISEYKNLKKGFDITLNNGTVIQNNKLTFAPTPSKSYAYCSDTAYSERIIPIIKGVDVLYHESTFLEEHAHLTEKTKHSTAKQAAQIAKQAVVKQLILGHYSTRYKEIDHFKKEAEEIFKQVSLADDGKIFVFDNLLKK